jgi:hypothetical protein
MCECFNLKVEMNNRIGKVCLATDNQRSLLANCCGKWYVMYKRQSIHHTGGEVVILPHVLTASCAFDSPTTCSGRPFYLEKV